VIAIGATTMRYATVVREMNVLFSGHVMVVSKDTIVVQAIPITIGSFKENSTEELETEVGEVEEAVPVLFIPSMISPEDFSFVPPNFTIGIPVDEWQQMLGPIVLKNNEGRFPTNESSNEIFVGTSLADQNGWTLNTEILVKGHPLKVVGVVETKLAILARGVVMPLALAQRVHNYPKSVNMILAKPKEGHTQEELAQTIDQRFPSFAALTEDKRNDMIQPILAQVETWNLGIQTVVLVISLILVMTVNLMSVSERRRDFATLDAMGAPLSYTFRLVVTEASLIGVIGGFFGLVFGSFASLVLASLYSNIPLTLFFPSLFEIVPPLYMLEIFGVTVLVSCVGGIIPAVNASRMRIAEVLRAEY
jgi:ABC-type lipoprotein release transport system permease subunit